MNEELVEEGIVKNTRNGIANILLSSNDNCEECTAKIFCKPNEDSSRIISVKNSNVKVGDKVSITIPGRTVLNASVKLYLYPLIIFITVILFFMDFFSQTKQPEFYSFLLGISITALYYLLFFQLGKKSKNSEPELHVIKSE